MKLVTLAEAKERLSIDFNYKDSEIEDMINSIEGYLSLGTGLNLNNLAIKTNIWEVARSYIFLRLYLDYYNSHTDLDDNRLNELLTQIKVFAIGIDNA